MLLEKKPDKVLMVTVFILLVFGLAMVASAGVIYSKTRFGDHYYFIKRQFFYGLIPGLMAMYFFSKFEYQRLKKIAAPFFLLSLIFLVLVFVPGIGARIYGANRWVQMGPISFQPSEMFKLAMILYLAAWLATKSQRRIKDFFEGLLPFVLVIALAGFLILKQPDTGTLGVIVLTALAIFFASGARISYLLGLGIAGVAGLGILIKAAPYRLQRLLVFLNPETDPQGIGYHISQALIAIGSGGIFGKGFGYSREKFNYLPEPAGDSIFAIIGEELGLIGALIIVLLFILLALRGYRLGMRAPDDFGRLLAVGITSWIILQAFINISAITGIIPLTGIPLPFISYGGTSLVFLLTGVGILLNISKQTN